MHFQQKCFREKEMRKARVFGGEERCCVNPSICTRYCKKEEGKRLELQGQRNLR